MGRKEYWPARSSACPQLVGHGVWYRIGHGEVVVYVKATIWLRSARPFGMVAVLELQLQ